MHQSLEGLSVGDAFGQQFMWHADDIPGRLTDVPDWKWTDDTEMALSVARILLAHGRIDQDRLARSFGEEFDSGRGYGNGMLFDLLPRLQKGHDWRHAAPSLFDGHGSYGNGAAMRVAPLGAYFADDVEQAIQQAKRSAEVTHSHSEAIAGAVAVAVAAACLPHIDKSMTPTSFLERVADSIPPDSRVASGIRQAIDLLGEASAETAAAYLGNGSRVTAMDTVPFCLFIVATYPDDYEEALWQTVAQLGDMDTNCAIVGGILAARVGVDAIPAEWRRAREPLPQWHLTDGHQYVR